MLRHYDSLNWQIGSILIAGTVVLTGLVFNKDTIQLLYQKFWATIAGLLVANAICYFVLIIWLLWFRRHRDYYNLRNEVLHRIELRRGMFHHLAVVRGDLCNRSNQPGVAEKLARLDAAREAAYGALKVFYDHDRLPRPSGYALARALAFTIPILQSLGILGLMAVHHWKLL
jgi:hypothetical protein